MIKSNNKIPAVPIPQSSKYKVSLLSLHIYKTIDADSMNKNDSKIVQN